MFKDHFSKQAPLYRQYRPHYPPVLFDWLAKQAPDHTLAWDCATGSGQAALGLQPFFNHVIATDASFSQLKQVINKEKISYLVATAEHSPIALQSISLISIAQALHWFNIELFYQEVKSVLKPKGIIAIWTYNLMQIEPQIDAIIQRLYFDYLGDFWPIERKLVEEGYKNISFPFNCISAPEFYMSALWEVEQLIGYLNTWSATQKYKQKHGRNPVDLIEKDLRQYWQNGQKEVYWPLVLKVGKI